MVLTLANAQRLVNEQAKMRLIGFEDSAVIEIIALTAHDETQGAVFGCVIIYNDQKKKPVFIHLHEKSMTHAN